MKFRLAKSGFFPGLLMLLAGGMGLLSGCGSAGPEMVEGEVLSVDQTRHLIVLREEGGAERTFVVEPVYARWAQAGSRIRGELRDGGEEEYPGLGSIWPADPAAERAMASFNRRLQQDTIIHGTGAFREIGETVSEFALFNERGQVVTPQDWRGQRILINFIFTRCLDASMCPAATRLMRETQRLAAEREVEDLRFLSVTLDPAYDTPAILFDYARAYGIDLDNFSFLTGPDEAIRDLMLQLGLLREQDEREIWRHSVATVLLDPQRRVLFRTTSKTWSPEEIIRLLQRDRETEEEG